MADERIPVLLSIPARVRFLSCEPLLSPIDLALDAWFDEAHWRGEIVRPRDGIAKQSGELIHWVIVGGESGPHARPMDLAWMQSLADQCQAMRAYPFSSSKTVAVSLANRDASRTHCGT